MSIYFNRHYLKISKWHQIVLARLFGKKNTWYDYGGSRITTYTLKGVVYITKVE